MTTNNSLQQIRKNQKDAVYHVVCVKHGVLGKVQIKVYVEPWDSLRKRPVTCYLPLKHLAEPVRKQLSTYGLSLRSGELV